MKLNKFKDEYGNGVISQGIAIPIKHFQGIRELEDKHEGFDVTDILGVTYADPEDVKRKTVNPNIKYNAMKSRHKKIFSNKFIKKMMNHRWFREIMFVFFGKKSDKPLAFPSWIQKTDEERIENIPQILDDKKTVWVMTEKIDGTSSTYAIDFTKKKRFCKFEPELIVCSRNIRQSTPDQKTFHDTNVYWEMAEKYRVKDIILKIYEMYKHWNPIQIILQGETFGECLQGNPYKMKNRELRIFNIIIKCDDKNSSTNECKNCLTNRFNPYEIKNILESANDLINNETPLKAVPILGNWIFSKDYNMTMDEFKQFADGYSKINENVLREGIVFRDLENAYVSFKNVSNQFLLKKK